MKIINNYKIKIYLHFSTLIFVSCLVLVGISYFGYTSTLSKIETQRLEDVLYVMDKQVQSMDKSIQSASLRTYEITLEQEFVDMILFDNPMQPPHYSKYLDLQATISKFHLLNEYIVESVFMFDFKQPLMMTNNDIVTNTELYYGEFFTFGNLNNDEFIEFCKKNMVKGNLKGKLEKQIDVMTNNENFSVLPYIKSIYVQGTNHVALALLLVNIDNLIDHLPTSIFDLGGQISIYDKNNTVLSGSLEAVREEYDTKNNNNGIIKSDGKTILYSKGTYTGATFFMHVPDKWIHSQTLNIMGSLKFYIPILLIVSLLLGALMTYYYANPLVKIVTKIIESKVEDERIKNAYNYIQESYYNVFKSSEDYHSKIESWKPLLINGALERLFKGGFIDSEEQEEIVWLYDSIPEKYRVFMVEWVNDSNSEKIMNQLVKVLDKRLKGDNHFMLIHIMSKNSICAIIDAGTLITVAEKANFDSFIRGLFKDLIADNNQILRAGMGGEYQQIGLVSMSVLEAKRAIRASL